MSNKAQGPDISYYDGSFDPAKATKQIDFVIQRISYGGYNGGVYEDPAYRKMYPAVAKVPVRGGYHYFSTSSEWKRQADFFLASLHDKDFHFLALDFESAFNQLSAGASYNCDQWMSYVQKETSKRVLFYTNLSLYNLYGYHYCSKWPLWLAWYRFWPWCSPDKPIALPKKRTSGQWSFWQWQCEINKPPFVNTSRQWGCSANAIDLNVYNGTPAEMLAWVNGSISPSPTSTSTEKRGRVIVGSLRLRDNPLGNIIGRLPYMTIVTILETSTIGPITWARVGDRQWAAMINSGTIYIEEL